MHRHIYNYKLYTTIYWVCTCTLAAPSRAFLGLETADSRCSSAVGVKRTEPIECIAALSLSMWLICYSCLVLTQVPLTLLLLEQHSHPWLHHPHPRHHHRHPHPHLPQPLQQQAQVLATVMALTQTGCCVDENNIKAMKRLLCLCLPTFCTWTGVYKPVSEDVSLRRFQHVESYLQLYLQLMNAVRQGSKVSSDAEMFFCTKLCSSRRVVH